MQKIIVCQEILVIYPQLWFLISLIIPIGTGAAARIPRIKGVAEEVIVGWTSAFTCRIVPAVDHLARVPLAVISEALQERILQDLFDSVLENIAEAEFLETRKQITREGRTVRQYRNFFGAGVAPARKAAVFMESGSCDKVDI
jgi:hypothetical protein